MGRKPRRVTDETAAVLSLFLDQPQRSWYGLEIITETSIPSGSLYPILLRLEARGVIDGVWEEIDEVAAGRRRRRYHRITPDGVAYASSALQEWRAVMEPRRRAGAPLIANRVEA